MKTLHLKSSVGRDGILTLRVPFDVSEAGHNVNVTVELLDDAKTATSTSEWQKFLDETYGSLVGLGVMRQDRGSLEVRESIE